MTNDCAARLKSEKIQNNDKLHFEEVASECPEETWSSDLMNIGRYGGTRFSIFRSICYLTGSQQRL